MPNLSFNCLIFPSSSASEQETCGSLSTTPFLSEESTSQRSTRWVIVSVPPNPHRSPSSFSLLSHYLANLSDGPAVVTDGHQDQSKGSNNAQDQKPNTSGQGAPSSLNSTNKNIPRTHSAPPDLKEQKANAQSYVPYKAAGQQQQQPQQPQQPQPSGSQQQAQPSPNHPSSHQHHQQHQQYPLTHHTQHQGQPQGYYPSPGGQYYPQYNPGMNTYQNPYGYMAGSTGAYAPSGRNPLAPVHGDGGKVNDSAVPLGGHVSPQLQSGGMGSLASPAAMSLANYGSPASSTSGPQHTTGKKGYPESPSVTKSPVMSLPRSPGSAGSPQLGNQGYPPQGYMPNPGANYNYYPPPIHHGPYYYMSPIGGYPSPQQPQPARQTPQPKEKKKLLIRKADTKEVVKTSPMRDSAPSSPVTKTADTPKPSSEERRGPLTVRRPLKLDDAGKVAASTSDVGSAAASGAEKNVDKASEGSVPEVKNEEGMVRPFILCPIS